MKFNFLCTSIARSSLQNIYLEYTGKITSNIAMMMQKAFNAGAKSSVSRDAKGIDKANF